MSKQGRKRHSPEKIIRKLREAEAMLAVGKTIGQVVQTLEISEQTYHRWRNQYGGMKAEEAKRLKQLVDSNVPAKSKSQTKHTTSEAVYRRIHRAIVSGEIPGGLELREVALAKEYQVSRTPVREALRRLANDGLVNNYPNRGSIVVNLTKKDALDIYQVRELLEVGSARLAAKQIDREQIDELRTLVATGYAAEGILSGGAADRILSDDAVDRLMNQDERFHYIIATASKCERLKSEIFRSMQQVRQLRQMVQVRHEVWSRGGWVRLAVHDHERIVDALEKGDGEAAAALMAWHIRSSRRFLADAFDELAIG